MLGTEISTWIYANLGHSQRSISTRLMVCHTRVKVEINAVLLFFQSNFKCRKLWHQRSQHKSWEMSLNLLNSFTTGRLTSVYDWIKKWTKNYWTLGLFLAISFRPPCGLFPLQFQSAFHLSTFHLSTKMWWFVKTSQFRTSNI